MKWIHFTDDIEKFPTGITIKQIQLQDPASFANCGLCVYRYDPGREDEMATEWGREGVVIECPEEAVELLQESPLNDPVWDEYIILLENFNRAKILRGW